MEPVCTLKGKHPAQRVIELCTCQLRAIIFLCRQNMLVLQCTRISVRKGMGGVLAVKAHGDVLHLIRLERSLLTWDQFHAETLQLWGQMFKFERRCVCVAKSQEMGTLGKKHRYMSTYMNEILPDRGMGFELPLDVGIGPELQAAYPDQTNQRAVPPPNHARPNPSTRKI